MLEKPKKLTLVEQVADQLQTLIESGQWPVGTRIPPEPELSETLGVSRNTIREAVRAMVHAGLLQTKQGDGTYVCSSSVLGVVLQKRVRQSTLAETLEVRQALEREAARLAAKRRTDEDIDSLRLHLDACAAAEESGDMEAYSGADILLHQAVVTAAHNELFSELYAHMTEALDHSVRSLSGLIPEIGLYRRSHAKMIDAIIRQDVEEAAEAVHEYISYSRNDLKRLEEQS
ncbi:FadR/GntR family transcriptional regulator [Paenibacillus sp. GbtcB18]|uniref:FadR/GntR family transcriptional regulator n=1 Tax=Paenibacillus sp. GbtcB18 TaxID=2824763 RepID=UPI001C306897|nr:FadR/GntR family transcriptional regulator [Paenibacillus sp. GbtcB18]